MVSNLCTREFLFLYTSAAQMHVQSDTGQILHSVFVDIFFLDECVVLYVVFVYVVVVGPHSQFTANLHT